LLKGTTVYEIGAPLDGTTIDFDEPFIIK